MPSDEVIPARIAEVVGPAQLVVVIVRFSIASGPTVIDSGVSWRITGAWLAGGAGGALAGWRGIGTAVGLAVGESAGGCGCVAAAGGAATAETVGFGAA